MVLVGEFITNQKAYLEDYRMKHLNNKLKGKENIKSSHISLTKDGLIIPKIRTVTPSFGKFR